MKTTRLRSSINDIVRFGSAVEAAATAAASGAATGIAALQRQEQAAISALQKVQKFQDQVARSSSAPNLTAGFNKLSTTALDKLTTAMTRGQLSTLQYQRAMEQVQ